VQEHNTKNNQKDNDKEGATEGTNSICSPQRVAFTSFLLPSVCHASFLRNNQSNLRSDTMVTQCIPRMFVFFLLFSCSPLFFDWLPFVFSLLPTLSSFPLHTTQLYSTEDRNTERPSFLFFFSHARPRPHLPLTITPCPMHLSTTPPLSSFNPPSLPLPCLNSTPPPHG